MGRVILSGVAPQMKAPVIPILFYTTFAEKQSDWTEAGGSFNYGNGLYVPEGGTKGTIASGEWLSQTLTIPVNVNEDFIFSFSNLVKSTVNNGFGGFSIDLNDSDGNYIARVIREDWWAGSTKQITTARTPNQDIYSNTNASYNGTTYDFKLICNEGTIAFYMDNVLMGSLNNSFVPVASIAITFLTNYQSTYQYPEIRINSMKIERVR